MSTFFSLLTVFFFFFNDTATTEIYTLSLHDALPICANRHLVVVGEDGVELHARAQPVHGDVLARSEEHTSELQSLRHLVCRLLLEIKRDTSELQSLRHLVCRLLLEQIYAGNAHTVQL